MNRRYRPHSSLRLLRPVQSTTFRYPQPTLFILLPLLILILLLSGCSLPQVKAEDRLFLDLSLDYLGSYDLPNSPKLTFSETPVGGLSGITYDRQRDRFYAISDDRSDRAPARFYTLIGDRPEGSNPFQMRVEKVTTLTDEAGQPFAKGTLDTEGIALSPRRSLYISSEGVSRDGIAPFINEFDLETGALKAKLPIPERFLPQLADGLPAGIVDNRGFESLTLIGNNTGTTGIEPFRVFAATESALHQDISISRSASRSDPPAATSPSPVPPPVPIRLLHYLVGEDLPTLLAEHIYLLDQPPAGAQEYGLSEMLVLDQGGHFLTLERSFGPGGLSARIYQMIPASATDTSDITRLRGDLSGITPVYKELVLDLATLDVPLDNLEGMTLGPQLADGSQSLLLVSDDNFNDLQTTQFLLFRLKHG